MFNALLAWLKDEKVFLKVQAGTGDNLLEEDIREGFTDYCLWSTFRPESIDTDGELDMECLDSGMVLFRENCTPGEALESSYRQAFGTDFDKDDCIVILSEVEGSGGGSLPLPAAALSAGSADCHPREGGDLLSNPRPNRLPDTPSPKGSAPKTPKHFCC